MSLSKTELAFNNPEWMFSGGTNAGFNALGFQLSASTDAKGWAESLGWLALTSSQRRGGASHVIRPIACNHNLALPPTNGASVTELPLSKRTKTGFT